MSPYTPDMELSRGQKGVLVKPGVFSFAARAIESSAGYPTAIRERGRKDDSHTEEISLCVQHAGYFSHLPRNLERKVA